MCLGPKLEDGSQVLILLSDSQNQYAGVLRDCFKTIVIKKNKVENEEDILFILFCLSVCSMSAYDFLRAVKDEIPGGYNFWVYTPVDYFIRKSIHRSSSFAWCQSLRQESG